MAGDVCNNFLASFVSCFFEYETPKIVHIKSKTVGLLSRFIQLCIITYVIGYAIIYNRGYQEFDSIYSVVTAKLKGIVSTKDPKIVNEERIWDVADYVIPPQENGAFFVMTRVLVTHNQTMGTCAEDWNVEASNCTAHEDVCKNYTDLPIPAGNGIATGKCVDIPESADPPSPGKVCEIKAWCPTETDDSRKLQIVDSSKFTVLIKNSIEFSKFKVKRRNILDNYTADHLQNCNYNAVSDPYCPIFVLEDIVKSAQENYSQMAEKGGVISVIIKWDCNLDWDISYCRPQYKFERLDDKNDLISKGWNFRYADHYLNNNVASRTLYKAYGIRFVVMIEGRAGKFNIIPLFFNLGAGLALLSITTVICDIVVLYFTKKRQYYYEKKYLQVLENSTEESAEISAKITNYGSFKPQPLVEDD